MWVEVIFSFCVGGSKPSFPIVLPSPVQRGPRGAEESTGWEEARASAEGGICSYTPPTLEKPQVAGMQNNTKRGWLGFVFSTSPSKKLCFILAWKQNATTPFGKHCNTISRPNPASWGFNQTAVRYQVWVDAEGLWAWMRHPGSSQMLCTV